MVSDIIAIGGEERERERERERVLSLQKASTSRF